MANKQSSFYYAMFFIMSGKGLQQSPSKGKKDKGYDERAKRSTLLILRKKKLIETE